MKPISLTVRLSCFLCVFSFALLSINLNADTPEFEPGKVIIKLKQSSAELKGNSLNAINQIAVQNNVKKISKVHFSNTLSTQSDNGVYVMEFDEDCDILNLCNNFNTIEGVEFAEPNYPVKLFAQPNDSNFDNQDYLRTAYLNSVLSLPINHYIKVGVVDSGIQTNHNDLIETIYTNTDEELDGEDSDGNGLIDDRYGYNFYGTDSNRDSANPQDPIGHGTHIAGIIAAKGNNSYGVAGINNGAELINVSFLNASGFGSQLDAARAIHYAINMGAKVINCSWGYFYGSNILKAAVERAETEGVIVVAAAGNDNSSTLEYPAAFPTVLAIGSVDRFLQRSFFSSYGNHIDYVTYGERIYNTIPENRFISKSGTSQAAAIVSGIISRILSYDNTLTKTQIMAILTNASLDLGDTGKDRYFGNGFIDTRNIFPQLNLTQSDTFVDMDSRQPRAEQNFSSNQNSSAFDVHTFHNFPNPVDGTRTSFGIKVTDVPARVSIKVYSLMGHEITELNSTLFSTNYSSISWDTKDVTGKLLGNGTYMTFIEARKGQQVVRKMGKLTILR